MANESSSDGSDLEHDLAHGESGEAPRTGFYAPRPPLPRGLDDSTRLPGDEHSSDYGYGSRPDPQPPYQLENQPTAFPRSLESQRLPEPFSDHLSGRSDGITDGADSTEDVESKGAKAPAEKPRFWHKQPYSALAHLMAIGGTVTAAWLLGILVAQLLPGRIARPPLTEVLLRQSSRLATRLWHFPQLWQTPTDQLQIQAIPLPETGPLLAPVELPPIERQPLIDELNSIETEVITLDRRLKSLEKQLGYPPYRGADIDYRLKALRAAIDPPVRAEQAVEPTYQPVPSDRTQTLLDVAALKITLPADAIFSPGASDLKDTAILNQVLDQLVNYPQATIVIRSYSDDQSDVLASRISTLAQANALSAYLQTALPTPYRWVTLGGGQAQPVASNEEAANRQRNRRIEILVDTRS